MKYYFIGLGNPGDEYKNTRHNVGRVTLEAFRKQNDFPDWKKDIKINALVSKGTIGKDTVMLVLPETFMNNSGKSIKALAISGKKNIKTKKTDFENIVVAHDELDTPFASLKMSYNKSSGGHNGVESIIKALKAESFLRLRIGISPSTSTGKLKKPKGDEMVQKFILGKFKDDELVELKKLFKKTSVVLETLITSGREKATMEANS